MESEIDRTFALSVTDSLVSEISDLPRAKYDSVDGYDVKSDVIEIDGDGNIMIRDMESLPSCGSTASLSDIDSASDSRGEYTMMSDADKQADQYIEAYGTEEPIDNTEGNAAADYMQHADKSNGLNEQTYGEEYENTATRDRGNDQDALTSEKQRIKGVEEDTVKNGDIDISMGETLVQKSRYKHTQSSTRFSEETEHTKSHKTITRVSSYTRPSGEEPPLLMSGRTLVLHKEDGSLEANDNTDRSQGMGLGKPHTVMRPQITNSPPKQVNNSGIFASFDLPYVMTLESGLIPGLAINIDTYIWRISRSVEIQLLGKLHAMVMKIACQGDITRVTFTTFVNDTSTAEASIEGRLCIHRSQRVLIKLVAQRKIFKVYIDGQHFLDYEHKLPLNKLNQLLLNGEMFLYDVYFNKTTESSRMPLCCFCCC